MFERHVQSVAELERENEQLKELNSSLHEEIEEWKSNYANLEEEKRKMLHEMQAEIRTLQDDVEKAETTNKELIDYTERLQTAQQDYKGFDSLSEEEKEKVDKILFLLDKFCVGDSFYHEFSMYNDLPKSYIIKQRRTQLNDMCHTCSVSSRAGEGK